MKKRVLLGLSGGVDSTYAAKALAGAGYTVECAVLRMHAHTDLDSAFASAGELGLPLHVIDCTDVFEKTVVENFLDEYTAARTPNPCVICNREVKFKYLLEFADRNGFDMIATGHYARVVSENGRFAVARAGDARKDQTYMLWRLSQDVLSRLLLPLSDVKKENARKELKESGISAAERSDSQEICFIPDGDYAAFVEARRGKSEKGSFVSAGGEVLGTHEGLIRYTVGQRKGLGISLGARAFVTDIDPASNTVTLSLSPKVSNVVFISGMVYSGRKEPEKSTEFTCQVKLRYLAAPVGARAFASPDGTAKLYLDEPVRSVTPGQSAVLYDGDKVLAGGFIDAANTVKMP